MTLLEYLKNIYYDFDNISNIFHDDLELLRLHKEDNDCAILIEKIQVILHGNKYESDFWEVIFDYIDENLLTDISIKYFIDNDIGLVRLAHLNLSDKWLRRISDKVDEALLTLSKRFYNSKNYSTQQFISLLCEFYKKSYVFSALLLFKSDNEEKNRALLYYLHIYNEDKQNIHEEILSYILSYTDDTNLIRHYYKTNNYMLLLGICKNFFTPNDILEELSHIKNIRMSKNIRSLSLQTLKNKAIINKDEN